MSGDYVQVDGETLWVEDSGGSAPALLFVHGSCLSQVSWAKQRGDARLAEFRHVYVDLPGHGRSRPSPSPAARYSFPGYAVCIAQLARALELDAVVLVGHSTGGYVTLEAAGDFPGLRGVMVFGTAPLSSVADMERALLPSEAFEAAFSEHVTEDQARLFAEAIVGDGTSPPDWAVSDFLATDGKSRSHLMQSLGEGRMGDGLATARQLGERLALLHAREDLVVRPEYLETLGLSPWRGGIQYLDCGHTPQWERPEDFNALVADFATSVC